MTDAGAAEGGVDVEVGDAPVPEVDELTRVVALDGPAGSGKSTVARRTAQALGWRFVDTGATYRAVTLQVLRSGVPLDDDEAVTRAAEATRLVLDVDPYSTRVELAGEDVSAEIRGPAVTAAVSAVSAVPGVRRHLVLLQRQLMGRQGAVVEGRDISTVVAPRAGVKVYLDAREEVRAQRRAADHAGALTVGRAEGGGGQQQSRGTQQVDVAAVQADIRRRDALDDKTNKLEVSEGAVHLDTSDMTLDEVVGAVVAMVRSAGLDGESR